MFAGIGIFALLFLVIAVSLGSCSASIEGAGSVIGITTYPSSDEDIYAAENRYAALESALNQQINEMERRHPNYDEYQYNIAEIGHNPYHLISYLTAKYGDWTYSDVENELQSLFEAQYHLNTEGRTETVTETRNVRVGESLGQVVTSGYCNCRICCGVWSGGPTASGAYPTANHTIAVDASNPFVPIGTKVVMNGVEYTVEDTGAFARYGVQFDVYYDNHAAASAHGHQTWEAYIADDNGSQEVTVTSTSTKKILYVTLTNGSFDAVARANLNAEQLIIYNALNTTYGNRNYLWDVNNVTSGSGGNGMSYEIPPEALQDEEFARMIREAEKYLGVPYVWGGYSPSGFDCSGFVSYVINHCGNGWNYGRLTAEGLRGVCTYVSPQEAKPGDLIFFQGTYNTSGASHVGIYVGNNMMIHCGDPIHYSNISTSYWQQHFMCFTTKNNNTFYIVIDRSATSQNVYMLSQIDENDLSEFLDKDSTATVVTPQPDKSKVVLDETNNEDIDKEATIDPEKTASAKINMGAMATILILALGGVAAYYYFKIYKPKKEEDEDDQPEGLETGGLEEVPDEEESEDEDFEENEK
jgi:cell wall-associated NlpC family hydrolase/3D (Asp-Asp-Asp) domain-containing protein